MKTFVFLLAAAWVLAGCNTLEGFGRDMKKAGEAVERAAR